MEKVFYIFIIEFYFHNSFSSFRNEEYGKLEDNGVNQENDLRSTYEELEKVNDWKGGIRERPRLRGDQRMDLDSKEVLDTRENRFNKYSEGSRRNWYQREPDR